MRYSEAGVDIDLGDDASKILYNAAKETFKNRTGNIGELIVPFDDFSGVRVIDVGGLPKGSVMCLGFDGVGTKVEIAQRMDNHKTIAFDLFAMVCEDAIVRGGEPVLIGSVLDTNSLGRGDDLHIERIRELAEGYISAAREANVAVVNGELAELGDAVGGYGSFKYNWCSGLVWFARKGKLFRGDEIQPDDAIVALQEDGFRSNGLSLVRHVFEKEYGSEWHNHRYEGKKLGDHVLEPSRIYTKAMVHMHGGFQTSGTCRIHGIVHVTGGGVPGKLGRVLKASRLGAKLDNLYAPCKAMKLCQKIGSIPDREAYRTWNMGQGLLVITPEPEKVIEEARSFSISAKVCGRVTTDRSITLVSRGFEKPGRDLVFSGE